MSFLVHPNQSLPWVSLQFHHVCVVLSAWGRVSWPHVHCSGEWCWEWHSPLQSFQSISLQQRPRFFTLHQTTPAVSKSISPSPKLDSYGKESLYHVHASKPSPTRSGLVHASHALYVTKPYCTIYLSALPSFLFNLSFICALLILSPQWMRHVILLHSLGLYIWSAYGLWLGTSTRVAPTHCHQSRCGSHVLWDQLSSYSLLVFW